MAKYKVQWDYSSSIGAFDKGATVEVDDALAEHVNRDSPGVLKPVGNEKGPSVKDVIASVGDDPEKASEALAAETEAAKPRKSLIEALTALLAIASGSKNGGTEGGNGES